MSNNEYLPLSEIRTQLKMDLWKTLGSSLRFFCFEFKLFSNNYKINVIYKTIFFF